MVPGRKAFSKIKIRENWEEALSLSPRLVGILYYVGSGRKPRFFRRPVLEVQYHSFFCFCPRFIAFAVLTSVLKTFTVGYFPGLLYLYTPVAFIRVGPLGCFVHIPMTNRLRLEKLLYIELSRSSNVRRFQKRNGRYVTASEVKRLQICSGYIMQRPFQLAKGNGFILKMGYINLILVSECLPGIISVRLFRSYVREGSNSNESH